jgi:hypothetical protein
MIAKFPDDWQLISFFESEPKIDDPRIPWLYNRLVFDYRAADDYLRAIIWPADGDFDFIYQKSGIPVFRATYHWVQECNYFTEGRKEYLQLKFNEAAATADTFIFLKPNVFLQTGNSR